MKKILYFLIGVDLILINLFVAYWGFQEYSDSQKPQHVATPSISPNMNMVLPNYGNNKFPLKFSIANLKKDVTLALVEMKKAKIKLPVLIKTQSVYNNAVKKGLSGEDFSAIIKVIEKS